MRKFLFPILLRYHKTPVIWTDQELVSIRLLPICRMAGTMRTTTLYLEVKFGSWKRQFSFCWRPDVTHYYWIRWPRYERAQKKLKESK